MAPFSLGFFEQDLRAEVRMETPSLYKSTQAGKNFNTRVNQFLFLFLLSYYSFHIWIQVFWKWVGFALFHSVILFFGICLVIPQGMFVIPVTRIVINSACVLYVCVVYMCLCVVYMCLCVCVVYMCLRVCVVYMYSEVPFSNGDASGLWYAGNIVYSVSMCTT